MSKIVNHFFSICVIFHSFLQFKTTKNIYVVVLLTVIVKFSELENLKGSRFVILFVDNGVVGFTFENG